MGQPNSFRWKVNAHFGAIFRSFSGISSNIDIRTPSIKLHEVLSLCDIYISKSKIIKKTNEALLGSLMFLHKAIIPAWLTKRTLALLRNMGQVALVAID
jgi:hypothetical protein